MGTGVDDEYRHSEHLRMNEELRVTLERSRVRREAEQAAARRTRLHSFGIAGGRRPARGE